MKKVTAGQPRAEFIPPPGVTIVPIDPQTGLRATDQCPVVIDEAFYNGEEPQAPCSRHGSGIIPVETAVEPSESADEGGRREKREPEPPAREKPWWRLF
jgi:membrane carboxypeptidase/penicillin-binding protein